jgi:hypothetical protein
LQNRPEANGFNPHIDASIPAYSQGFSTYDPYYAWGGHGNVENMNVDDGNGRYILRYGCPATSGMDTAAYPIDHSWPSSSTGCSDSGTYVDGTYFSDPFGRW